MKNFYYHLKQVFIKGLQVFKNFCRGLIWPFTWLESKSASVGLLLAVLLIVFLGTFSSILAIYALAGNSDSDGNTADNSSGVSNVSENQDTIDPNCNVVGIKLYGCLETYTPTDMSGDSCDTITSSDYVINAIRDVSGESRIKAVLLAVDSGGGSLVAGAEIADALKILGNSSGAWVGKPSVAWIRSRGNSAAYLAATGAGTIFASDNSDVGGIGVTYSYVDRSKQNANKGLTFNQLSSGIFKDTGDYDKPLTMDEYSLIMRDVNIMAQNFIKSVATNRHLSVAKVNVLADGSSMLGQAAKQNGLIDEVGTEIQVWEALQKNIDARPNVCWVDSSY